MGIHGKLVPLGRLLASRLVDLFPRGYEVLPTVQPVVVFSEDLAKTTVRDAVLGGTFLERSVAATALGQAGIKTLQTVPDARRWSVLHARLRYVASGVVGTRALEWSIVNAAGRTQWRRIPVQPTAGLVSVLELHLGPRPSVDTSITDSGSILNNTWVPFPWLAGWTFRVDDTANIDNNDTVEEEWLLEESA